MLRKATFLLTAKDSDSERVKSYPRETGSSRAWALEIWHCKILLRNKEPHHSQNVGAPDSTFSRKLCPEVHSPVFIKENKLYHKKCNGQPEHDARTYTVPALLTCLRHWLCLLMAGVLHVFHAGFCAVLSTVSKSYRSSARSKFKTRPAVTTVFLNFQAESTWNWNWDNERQYYQLQQRSS